MAVFYKTAAGQNAFTVATRVRGPIPSYPIPRDITAVVYEETWWQTRADYTPLARNTEHPTITGAYLVDERGHDDVGGGVISWQRIYATKPANRFDYARQAVTYPGWTSGFAEREPTTQTATIQITYEYFLVGPEGFCDYDSIDLIPITEESRVTDTAGMDSPLLSGIYLNEGGGTMETTTPLLSEYQTLVSDDADPDSYSIVLDCTPEPYMGNIIALVTRRVKAK